MTIFGIPMYKKIHKSIIIIIMKYQIYIALISNKCSEALNSATQNIIYEYSILMTSVTTMKP